MHFADFLLAPTPRERQEEGLALPKTRKARSDAGEAKQSPDDWGKLTILLPTSFTQR